MRTIILSICLMLISSVCFGQGGSTGTYAAASYGSTGSAAVVKSGGSTGASYAVTPVKVQLAAASGGSAGSVAKRTPIRTAIENAKARRENRRATVSVVVPVQATVQAGCNCVDCQCSTAQSTGSSAQERAEAMAASGRLSHDGTYAGPEGVGFSPRSAVDAIANCCYAGRLQARDVGVARGRDGWYAVQGY